MLKQTPSKGRSSIPPSCCTRSKPPKAAVAKPPGNDSMAKCRRNVYKNSSCDEWWIILIHISFCLIYGCILAFLTKKIKKVLSPFLGDQFWHLVAAAGNADLSWQYAPTLAHRQIGWLAPADRQLRPKLTGLATSMWCRQLPDLSATRLDPFLSCSWWFVHLHYNCWLMTYHTRKTSQPIPLSAALRNCRHVPHSKSGPRQLSASNMRCSF